MKTLYFAALILVAIFLAALMLLATIQLNKSERRCSADSDCACGRHIATGDCFYGNKNYVNVSDQCPDFCNGIAANLEIRCIDNECRQEGINQI